MVSPRVPWPNVSGWSVAVNATIDALVLSGAEVTFLAIDTSRHPGDISGLVDRCRMVRQFALDTDVRVSRAIRDTLRPPRTDEFGIAARAPYWVSRFASADVADRMGTVACESGPYDALVVEYLFALPVALRVANQLEQEFGRRPRVILRAHNVESVLQQRLARARGRFNPERWARSLLARQTSSWERAALDSVDAVACISDADRAIFARMGVVAELRTLIPAWTVVTGGDLPADSSVGFIGQLDYAVNVYSLAWFLDKIWPAVLQARPEAKFHIAGRGGTRPERWTRVPGVVYHGEVEDAIAFQQKCRVMVVPTLGASGLRIKLLEAMAAGRPVVTTSAGAEGLDIVDGKQVLVADDAAGFAEATVRLLADNDLSDSLVAEGRDFVATLSSLESSARDWSEICSPSGSS